MAGAEIDNMACYRRLRFEIVAPCDEFNLTRNE